MIVKFYFIKLINFEQLRNGQPRPQYPILAGIVYFGGGELPTYAEAEGDI